MSIQSCLDVWHSLNEVTARANHHVISYKGHKQSKWRELQHNRMSIFSFVTISYPIAEREQAQRFNQEAEMEEARYYDRMGSSNKYTSSLTQTAQSRACLPETHVS